MAGIYIHIPFCKQACTYCDFHFSTLLKYQEPLLDAIRKEVSLQKDFFGSRMEINTLYLGGGTPSLASENQLMGILDAVQSNFSLSKEAEITLEANPDDLNPEKLSMLKNAGINRLSIGIQSFRDEDLKLMRRSHSAKEAISAVKSAQDAGFSNLNADLIYGMPGQSLSDWEEQLRIFSTLEIPHLSSYSLTVEKGTLLMNLVAKEKIQLPEESLVYDQFQSLMKFAADKDYEHYEISNFARPGMRSRHNSSYWHGDPYLGLGPSAHSFFPYQRSWNVSNNAAYLRLIEEGKTPTEGSETLTKTDRLNEYLMTHLRLKEGISLSHILSKFEMDISTEPVLGEWIQKGLLEKENDFLKLTQAGKFLADALIRELFRA